MALSNRPVVPVHAAKAARRNRPYARLLACGLLGVLSYAGLTSGAFGPAGDASTQIPAAAPVLVRASLGSAPTAPAVEGFDHLFESASFTGPNRAEKTDRVRPRRDALAISQSFEEVRTRLAALRVSPGEAGALGQSRVADATVAAEDVDAGPRMSVASLDPAIGSSALDAIAGIAPTGAPGQPMPALASEQLAYARANAPVTGAFATGKALEVSDKELWCLATAIYFEARGESYRGQVAVAQVVLNRVKDHRYPNTICGVVFQNQHKRNSCQFSFACDGIPERIADKKSWAQAEDIAARFVDGELYLTEVADATHYHATYVRPAWAPRMQKLTQVGLHVFYKFKRGWLFG
jgi:spore germination cell wall hydrolase CwlJ-like protein